MCINVYEYYLLLLEYSFSTFYLFLLTQEDCELVKIDIHCHIQGDVVLECISLEEDLQREEMMFRVMFNTAFIRSNILMLDRDAIDILWDAKDRFPKNFRVEVCFPSYHFMSWYKFILAMISFFVLFL